MTINTVVTRIKLAIKEPRDVALLETAEVASVSMSES